MKGYAMANDFNIDLKESEIIASYLDRNFYSKLKTAGKIQEFRRNTSDMVMQYKGIDVVVERNGREYLIDEKSQSHYGRHPLPTFAFETSYLNKFGEKKMGWLIDEKKQTEFWLLIWPTIKLNQTTFSEDSVNHLDIFLIKCNAIIKYLDCYGWSRNEINKFDSYYRLNAPNGHKGEPTERMFEKYNTTTSLLMDRNMFYWYFSSQLLEKPINIVIRKRELKKLASSIFYVNSDRIDKIK